MHLRSYQAFSSKCEAVSSTDCQLLSSEKTSYLFQYTAFMAIHGPKKSIGYDNVNDSTRETAKLVLC